MPHKKAIALIVATALVALTPSTSRALDGECGTVVTPEQMSFESNWKNSQPLSSAAADDSTLYYVPVTIHVVRRTDGSGGLTPQQVLVAMRDINLQYVQAGMRFFRYRNGDDYVVYYINNDDYYFNTNTFAKYDQLRQVSWIPNTVNVYFCPNTNLCGISSFTTSFAQGMIVDNNCAGIPANNSTFAHEMGHYFNLYHTHETAFGAECPDGLNCGEAGDLICDTPADPVLTGNVNLTTCAYTGSAAPPQICGLGPYNPQTDNLMSYSGKLCRDLFTPEQISKMRYTLIGQRPYLFLFDSADYDADGVFDVADNCPTVANPDQADNDLDGWGDVCLRAVVSADKRVGNLPLEVNFAANSSQAVTTWDWDFGDGASQPIQNPTHTYTSLGSYDVTLTISDGALTTDILKPAYITVVADSLSANTVQLDANGKARVDVYAHNTLPTLQIILPFAWSGPAGLEFDSASRAGTRTDYFQIMDFIHFDPFTSEATIKLQSSSNNSVPKLEPGSGPVASLFFSAPTAGSNDTTIIKIEPHASYFPQFAIDAGLNIPVYSNGAVLGVPYMCGDADGSDEISIADVIFLIAYIFQGGPAPTPPSAGDANGAGGIDIADATSLISFIFSGGSPPVCP